MKHNEKVNTGLKALCVSGHLVITRISSNKFRIPGRYKPVSPEAPKHA
jgi:hypothetical protein